MTKLNLLIETVDKKLGTLPLNKVKELDATLELSVTEFVNYQELKSLAQLKGLISLNDAMLIYNALRDWDNQTIGTKIILTKLHADLLKARMQGKL
jgi:hypothetical protein